MCPTVKECINEMLVSKARRGLCDRYLRQLRVSLGSFAKGRANTPLSEISLTDVEDWLFNHDWRPRTIKGYRADLRALFRFAMNRGYVQFDAARGVELPMDDSKGIAPGIHTPDEVRRVLEYARRADMDVMRHLAIRYFAGLRSAEAHRIREEDLKIDRGFIEVPATKAKTRRRRLVRIQPNLAAWLALGGMLRPIGDLTIRRVLKKSGVPWKPNVTRHSFCSYHLAAFENAGKTALEAGHSEDMLFAHYRELVTPEDAAAFWAIVPK